MAPSWECQCHGQRDTELCCDGVLDHCRDGNQQTRSWELPVTEKTTVTFTFPAKSSASCRWAGSARLCRECGRGTGTGLAWPWGQMGTGIFLTAEEATADPRHNPGTGWDFPWSFLRPLGRLLPGAVPSVPSMLGTTLSQIYTWLCLSPGVSCVVQLRLHGGCSSWDLLPRAPGMMPPTPVPAIMGKGGHRYGSTK